jgi:adenine-specific DNA-methyltransferase
LDAQTDGLLINSENWQALNLLQEKFREQIKCIYIDPPYNTGGDGFLYKDSFRHSSWASMIHDRIELAAALANEESFFLSSIDNNEKFNLADVLRISHKFNLVSDISIVNNLKGRQDREHIATAHEHILAYESRKASSFGWDMNESSLDSIYTNTDKDGYRYEARDLRKRGGADTRKERQNLYFPIYWNPTTKIVSLHPIDEDAQEYLPVKSNGEDGCWRWKKETVLDRIEIVQPRLSTKGKLTGFSYRVYFDKVERRKVKPKSIWYEKNYSTDYANKSLKSIVGETGFDTPKSPVLMKNIFEHFSGDDDYVLDFFAGSGSSIHGVMLANNNGRRKVIAIEHGSYFKCILLNRLKRLMFSFCWKNKLPEAGSSYISIFKVQAFEQYEDVLDNLLPAWDDAALPHRVPVSYLYRPERNALSSSLDLSRPFDQTIRVGKKREEKTIDLMETWCYLQGYWIKSRRLYREFDRLYLAVETTHGTLVVFRDIDDAEDDTANLNAILAKYVPEDGSTTLRRLEINHDADLRRLTMDTVLISAADFMRGAQW